MRFLPGDQLSSQTVANLFRDRLVLYLSIAGIESMSLELSGALMPSSTPLSSPDFVTTLSRRMPAGTATDPTVQGTQAEQASAPIADRRKSSRPSNGIERRQFGSSYADLSPAAAELALAIDKYKMEHRRRYITCEEMLAVITRLGYNR